jgi:adenine deaminase
MERAELIEVARGDKYADLILKNAQIINVFTGSIEKNNIAIYKDRIAGIGEYRKAREIIDLKGAYLSPGFINRHIHIESSMLHPAQYACAVVPHGTTTICTDLHEITNVSGIDGIRFIMNSARQLPLDIFFEVASCVPATSMETAGANIGVREIHRLLRWKNNIGLGEMMNYPGVIQGVRPVMEKIEAAQGHIIEGHAPGLSGKNLNAYMAAGIYSDHEITDFEEGKEKLTRGMYLMIREGTSEKNLETLLPLVTDKTWQRCLFVVDDRSCSDLLHDGDVDAVVRKAIKLGLDPVRAIQMATINPALFSGLNELGSIRPGARANLITITDLMNLTIDKVFFNGSLVASKGRYTGPQTASTPAHLMHSVNIKPFTAQSLELLIDKDIFPVIEIIPGQIITRKRMVKIVKGIFQPDISRDLLKAVVMERHRATGNIGVGVIKGFGIKNGAIGTTVAHDSHNIVVVGSNDLDIIAAIKAINDMQGGLVVCRNGKVIDRLPLPICGLLSDDPATLVSKNFEHLEKTAGTLGNLPPAPFALLSFIALPVIPELRLTDKGIVDVLQFRIIS